MLKRKDHQQVLGIHQTGTEPILARSSRCPCAGLKAMKRDRGRQQTKLENNLISQYMCTGHATALAMPPPSLTASQRGKHKKGHEEMRVKRQGQRKEGGEQRASPSRTQLSSPLYAFPILVYKACGQSIRSLSPPCHLYVTSPLISDLPQGGEYIFMYTV